MRTRTGFAIALIIVGTIVQGPLVRGVAPQPSDESIAVRRASVDGLTLQYLEAGRGPTVVLLHDYTETSSAWRPLILRLAERFHVIAPDLPGIRGSEVSNG